MKFGLTIVAVAVAFLICADASACCFGRFAARRAARIESRQFASIRITSRVAAPRFASPAASAGACSQASTQIYSQPTWTRLDAYGTAPATQSYFVAPTWTPPAWECPPGVQCP